MRATVPDCGTLVDFVDDVDALRTAAVLLLLLLLLSITGECVVLGSYSRVGGWGEGRRESGREGRRVETK